MTDLWRMAQFLKAILVLTFSPRVCYKWKHGVQNYRDLWKDKHTEENRLKDSKGQNYTIHTLNSEISKGMLKPWNIQLKASPPPDACQQDHRFISGSTKKCGLPVCNLSFSYEGYFYVLKNIIHCHCKSCRRHKWVNSERLPSDWMKSQKIRS